MRLNLFGFASAKNAFAQLIRIRRFFTEDAAKQSGFATRGGLRLQRVIAAALRSNKFGIAVLDSDSLRSTSSRSRSNRPSPPPIANLPSVRGKKQPFALLRVLRCATPLRVFFPLSAGKTLSAGASVGCPLLLCALSRRSAFVVSFGWSFVWGFLWLWLVSAVRVRCRLVSRHWSLRSWLRFCALGARSLSVAPLALMVSFARRLPALRFFALRLSVPVTVRLPLARSRWFRRSPRPAPAAVWSLSSLARVRPGFFRRRRRLAVSPVSVPVRGRRSRSPLAWAFRSSCFRAARFRFLSAGLVLGSRVPARGLAAFVLFLPLRRFLCSPEMLRFFLAEKIRFSNQYQLLSLRNMNYN